MTKKEAVKALRIAFNQWVAGLPDVEYKRTANAMEIYDDDKTIGVLHKLELGAEEEGEAK